tara:strand:+ start:1431 stop:2048 length:618 start_codon:yes stop_codon:yes gene_type:complete
MLNNFTEKTLKDSIPTWHKLPRPGWFIKKKFLNYIKNDKISGGWMGITESTPDFLTKTSWEQGGKVEDDLKNLFEECLRSIISKKIKLPFELHNIWYQQYGKNTYDTHSYHDHVDEDSSISGIYYLKLGDINMATEFLYNNKPIIPEVKEGDLVIFDCALPHRSPVKTFLNRPVPLTCDKIILSFNLGIKGYENTELAASLKEGC